MKLLTIASGLAVAALAGMGLVPAMAPYARLLLAGILALGLYLALKALLQKSPAAAPAEIAAPAEAPTEVAAAAPAAPALPKNTAEAAAVTLLGIFQDKGRLLDFLMDDLTPYSDAQVGAAARVVHQGCKAALREHVTVVPVSSAAEGSSVTVPTDGPPDAYRLVGNISGSAPFRGTLVHKGWQAETVKLPRVLAPDPDRLPVIAPAQVELK